MKKLNEVLSKADIDYKTLKKDFWKNIKDNFNNEVLHHLKKQLWHAKLFYRSLLVMLIAFLLFPYVYLYSKKKNKKYKENR